MSGKMKANPGSGRVWKQTNSISLNVINICLRHNLNIKVVQIRKLIYTEFLGSKMAPPKVGGPTRPNTSNMLKAGPDRDPLRGIEPPLSKDPLLELLATSSIRVH